MAFAVLTFFPDTKDENEAVRLRESLSSLYPFETVTLEEYFEHKGGGYKAVCHINLAGRSKADIVVEVIEIAQIFGRGWILTGDINHEIDLWSNEPTLQRARNVGLIAALPYQPEQA